MVNGYGFFITEYNDDWKSLRKFELELTGLKLYKADMGDRMSYKYDDSLESATDRFNYYSDKKLKVTEI